MIKIMFNKMIEKIGTEIKLAEIQVEEIKINDIIGENSHVKIGIAGQYFECESSLNINAIKRHIINAMLGDVLIIDYYIKKNSETLMDSSKLITNFTSTSIKNQA